MRAASIVFIAALLAAGAASAQESESNIGKPMQVAIKCTPNLAQTTIREGGQPGLTTLELNGKVPTSTGTVFNMLVVNRDTKAVVGEQSISVMTTGALILSIPVYKLDAGRYAVGLERVDDKGMVGKCFFDVLRNN